MTFCPPTTILPPDQTSFGLLRVRCSISPMIGPARPGAASAGAMDEPSVRSIVSASTARVLSARHPWRRRTGGRWIGLPNVDGLLMGPLSALRARRGPLLARVLAGEATDRGATWHAGNHVESP